MKRRFRVSFLLLAGILLLGFGLAGLFNAPGLMQYAFLPSAEEETGMPEKFEEVLKNNTDAFPRLTLHGQKPGVTLTAGSKSRNDIFLYAAGQMWNEVYPRQIVNGRPLTGLDAEQGAAVIVIDKDTAFILFGDDDPVGRTVKIEEEEYEVVGVAAHSRRIGETGESAAWVPLGTVTGCELMVLSTPASTTDTFAMFRTRAEESFGQGTAISLAKGKTFALLPLLLVFLVAAVWVLKRWTRWYSAFARTQFEKVRAESRRRYALGLIPYAVGKLLPVALLAAATVAACYGVAVATISPARVFPEWIPESLGNFTSWISRFWDLTGAAAKPVSLQTPEQAEIAFYGGLVRWGTLLVVLAAAKGALSRLWQKKTEES